MNYELAKKLNDAGFLLNSILERRVAFPAGDVNEDNPTIYLPALEELIEACGVDLGMIVRVGSGDKGARGNGERGGWEAVSAAEMEPLWCWAKSAEEAAASLWLDLHENV
jgi:hypothetical protein